LRKNLEEEKIVSNLAQMRDGGGGGVSHLYDEKNRYVISLPKLPDSRGCGVPASTQVICQKRGENTNIPAVSEKGKEACNLPEVNDSKTAPRRRRGGGHLYSVTLRKDLYSHKRERAGEKGKSQHATEQCGEGGKKGFLLIVDFNFMAGKMEERKTTTGKRERSR